MAAESKNVKVQIDISASKANAELSKLVNKLDKIADSILELNNKELKGFTESVEKLGQSMQTVGKLELSNFTRFVDDVQRLSNLDMISIKELSSLGGMADTTEDTAEMAGAFESLAISMMVLKEAWDAITKLSDLGKTLTNTGNGLLEFFKVNEVLTKLGGNLAGLFNEILSMCGGPVIKALEGIRVAISSITGGTVAAPLGVIAAAIVAITIALVDLWNTSEVFRNTISMAFSMVKDTLVDAFQRIGDAVLPMWESIKGLGVALYELYEISGLKLLIGVLASLAAILVGIVSSIAIEIITSAIEGLAGAMQGAADIASGLAKVLTGVFTLDTEKIFEGFGQIGEGVVELIAGLGESLLGGIGELGEELYGRISEWWTETVCTFLNSIPEEFRKLLFIIGEIMLELPGKMIEIGKNIISGLRDGIMGEKGTLEKGVGDVCLGMVEGFRENLDIHSPSRVLAEIGSYAVLGLAEPFTDSGAIMEQIRAFSEALMNIFREQLSPENFALIAEMALLAFMESFQLGFENMYLISGESIQLLSTSVVEALTLLNQQITLIFTTIAMMMQQKWTLMLNQSRLFWLQMNQLSKQNLILLNTNLSVGMAAVNLGWEARWRQFVTTVRTACAEVQSAVSALNSSVQSMCSAMLSAIRAVKSAASSMGTVSIRTSSVRGFASGGYPETGELFLARENGMNEMVGRIGNRSAVANNDQIVEAIRSAVMQGINADGQNALLREQNVLLRAILEKDTDVSLDGRSLVDGIDRARKRMGRSFQFA